MFSRYGRDGLSPCQSEKVVFQARISMESQKGSNGRGKEDAWSSGEKERTQAFAFTFSQLSFRDVPIRDQDSSSFLPEFKRSSGNSSE